MDPTVLKFECNSEDEGFNSRIESNVDKRDVQDVSEEPVSQLFPEYLPSEADDYDGQPSLMDNGLEEQNAGGSVTKSPQLWGPDCFQDAPSNDNRLQHVHVQPDQPSVSSLKPQKTVKMWPINKRSRKKWTALYGQLAGKKIKCSECPETFLHKRSLSRHVAINHGPKVYFWCQRCCRVYNRRDNLRSHYRSHHPKHIRDLDHIQGVGRDSFLSEGQTLLAEVGTGPVGRSTYHLPSNNSQSVSGSSNPSISSNSNLSVNSSNPSVSSSHLFVNSNRNPSVSSNLSVSSNRNLSVSSNANLSVCSSNPSASSSNPSVSSNSPQVSCSDNFGAGSSTSKVGSKQIQAVQITEREQRRVDACEENLRVRTAVLHTNNSKSAGKGASFTAAIRQQSGQRVHPPKRLPTLSVPPAGICSEAKRPCVNAYPIPAAGSTRHPVTAADVLTLQLQHESHRAEGEVIQVSDDSSSDEELEILPQSSPGDQGTSRVERGAPFRDLQIEKVMQGHVTRVSEEHQTYIYSGGEKIRAERRTRTYNVLYLDKVNQGTQSTTPETVAIGPSLTEERQLERTVEGQVTKITETSSKYTYSSGQKVTKEKTSRVYDVMLLAGLTNV
ncbi:uncharacterized protein LOC110985983 [Acanthaster planci]|uniref:Uncharacterized protein LOC110985983 n=1 Tax=Acanthaster planci TaxID=133434 RepID=A0A8B7ZIW6_ACAPL|nr:uncharacterized protein LOC110985983 [Acanthaster planci]XP_022103235.1 uncharacterized protein LOC110985983 [Acanthaster planci]XP_022103244.1 uncharacterized protein LOC110985983 [Acanthaster planci]XP_022103252.1 uncharacterized protein LOC110985983 [Acanthaster planci]